MTEDLRVDLTKLAEGEDGVQLGDALKQALSEQGQSGIAKLSGEWLGGKAADAMNDALGELDLMSLFANAWAKAREIRAYADPAQHPQNKVAYVKLGEHTVDFDLEPKMSIVIGPWTSEPITLALNCSAEIEAIELRIQHGHITAASGGSCDLGAEIVLAGATLVPRKSLKKFGFPGKHSFAAPGIDLRPGAAETA